MQIWKVKTSATASTVFPNARMRNMTIVTLEANVCYITIKSSYSTTPVAM